MAVCRSCPGTHRWRSDRRASTSELFLREDLPENQALIATRVTPDAANRATSCSSIAAHSMRPAAISTDAVKLSLVFTYHAADNHPLPGTRSASVPSVAV